MKPTDEEIVNAAKSKGEERSPECFCDLVHSKKSRGVNSAFGIGFIEGAVWCREFLMKGKTK